MMMTTKLSKRFTRDNSRFGGLYNVYITLNTGEKKAFKRVFVDNEQWKLGNVRVTDEKGESTLIARSDYKRVEYDSKMS